MKKIISYALLCTAIVSFSACKSNAKDKDATESETTETAMSEPVIIVAEEYVYDVPVTKAAPTEATATEKNKKAAPEKGNATTKSTPTKVTHSELTENLAKAEITPSRKEDINHFSFSAEPVNSVQTVTAYEKKGVEVLQVVSDPANPDVIDHIVFTDRKNHVDTYGVSAGLTAKETRELRKDLKHFVKKGKVFLYHEDSNILYELDGAVSEGQVVTDELISNMHIASIIWKDKKDGDKEKIKVKIKEK